MSERRIFPEATHNKLAAVIEAHKGDPHTVMVAAILGHDDPDVAALFMQEVGDTITANKVQ